jgi:ribosomal protein L11 methyltransferase
MRGGCYPLIALIVPAHCPPALSFLSLTFDAEARDAERWADALLEAGALAIDAADRNAGSDAETARYDEPGADATFWPLSRLSALFRNDAGAQAILHRVSALLGVPMPCYTIATIPDDDWVRRTQQQFEPIGVAPGMWIVPTWCEPPDPGAINIRLDPGMAFGTGSHPSTRMCLQWLAQGLSGNETVLDYGCGSGILAIAAAKLGAATVVGVDVDEQAIAASRDNARRNDVRARFGPPESLREAAFDVVVANILANPLQLLAPALAAKVRSGGRIVLSGILAPQAAEVIAAYTRWFSIAVWAREDGWVALAGRRTGNDG